MMKFLERRRLTLSIIGIEIMAFIVLFSPLRFEEKPLIRTLAGAAGILLMLGGMALRIWALGHISGRKRQTVVRSGPYRLTRNPLYLGTFLFGCGMCVLGESLMAALFFLGFFFIVYGAAMRMEERDMETLFGEEFRAYRLTVPLFLPRLGAGRPSPLEGGISFRLRRPLWEAVTAIFLLVSAYAATAVLKSIHTACGLPSWFE